MALVKAAIIVSFLFGVTLAENGTSTAIWRQYKLYHGKHYSSPAEEEYRRSVWETNLIIIKKHNELFDRGLSTYRLGLNAYADLTNAEFRETMTKTIAQKTNRMYSRTTTNIEPVPDNVDWRQKGCVTPIAVQGQCGSSWAFAATGCIEGGWCAQTGAKPVTLSIQQLLDCTQSMGNFGCNGGSPDYALSYVIANNGIESNQSYPYKAYSDGICKADPKRYLPIHLRKFVDIPKGNESLMQSVNAFYGPVSIGVNASPTSFQLYASGIYSDNECDPTEINHGAVVVGYGADKMGKTYWIVKNTWGISWGMNGYMLIARDSNMCGIANEASYVVF